MHEKQVFKYDVALSFAGEQREYVSEVNSLLQSDGVRVFFDENEAVSLWGRDLTEVFDEAFRRDSRCVVMFISKQYLEKSWTTHERRMALARGLEERHEYVLPARFDNTEIPGLSPTIGFIDLTTIDPIKLAGMIERKIVQLGGLLPQVSMGKRQWLEDSGNRTSGKLSFIITDADDRPVEGVRIGIIRRNGTATYATTNSSGSTSLSLVGYELITIHVAKEGYEPILIREYDPQHDIKLNLRKTPGVSGKIFETSTGYLPGFSGRLAPIEDDGRFYVYGDNIAADGKPARPAYFTLGKPIQMEDSEGDKLLVTFLDVVGDHSLIRFQKML